jgi:D-methionine transport system ATP-binding protein
MIELVNISKTFFSAGNAIKALAGVSLSVAAGEIFGVIGASGAGKSTLIRCVNLLEKPDHGRVIVDGVELTTLSGAKLAGKRHEIGMIFQNFNLLSSRTVFGNVAFPLELGGKNKHEIRAKVEDLLELVGLIEKAHDYPAQLSGGQKQRVAIARALASEPKILLCDEATSALDPETTRSILRLLRSINEKMNLTILLITHEMEVIKSICDRVAVIDDGRLIEQGAVESVFSDPQTEIAKRFIRSSLKIELPLAYQNRLQNAANGNAAPVVRILLAGEKDESLVLAELSLRFGVRPRIINAQIENIGAINFGTLLLELTGEKEATARALEYLKTGNLRMEILGYV